MYVKGGGRGDIVDERDDHRPHLRRHWIAITAIGQDIVSIVGLFPFLFLRIDRIATRSSVFRFSGSLCFTTFRFVPFRLILFSRVTSPPTVSSLGQREKKRLFRLDSTKRNVFPSFRISISFFQRDDIWIYLGIDGIIGISIELSKNEHLIALRMLSLKFLKE